MRHDCVNLVEPTDKSIPQLCNTCGSLLVSVWYCKERGLCAPFVKGTIDTTNVVDCGDCNQYRSNGMFCKLEKIRGITYKCTECGRIVGTEYPKRYNQICSMSTAELKPELEPEMFGTFIKIGHITYQCTLCDHIVGTEYPERINHKCANGEQSQSGPEPEEIEPVVTEGSSDQEENEPREF